MSEKQKSYRIFLSAAEASGDIHCANLIKSLKSTADDYEFIGVGGQKMQSAGCRLLEKTTEKAAMAYKAIGQAAHFYKVLCRIKKYLRTEKVDMVVVCDSPAFNFHVAKFAKRMGIRTFFYVAPQLWAWGQWRIEKLKKCCDKLCCILPFEQQWFSDKGIDVSYVGNPLFDELEDDYGKTGGYYKDYKLEQAKIALLPGSRAAEIESLWRPMQQIAVQLKKKYPNMSFVTEAVDEKAIDVLRSAIELGFRCEYSTGSVFKTAREVDFCIVASGSATLQVAAAGCPMVVMYQSNALLWHLVGRWLIKTKYLSLVNILAKKQLVPEFMPYFKSVEPITQTIEKLLEDRDRLAQISDELIGIVKPLRKNSASDNTAKIITEMLEQTQDHS